MSVTRLAVVSCMFNPHRGLNRVRNYGLFAENTAVHGLPLFTIEAVFGRPSEIDSTWQIAVDPDAVLWHKERLLNIAIERLPDEYDAVLWCDADILFDVSISDLRDQCLECLQRHPVIQPWKHCQHLNADNQPMYGRIRSMAAFNFNSVAPNPDPKMSHPGFAWGARREVLSQAGGMYDRSIAGSGDTAFAFGCWRNAAYCERVWNKSQYEDLLLWVDRFNPMVSGNVGFVPIGIQHLWHGSIKDRQYVNRHKLLTQAGFDAAKHLSYAPNGTLRWSAEAPQQLKDAMRDYLTGRNEDQQMFTADQREAVLYEIGRAGNCSIADIRKATGCEHCRLLLAEFEFKGLVVRRWSKSAYWYSLTDEGRKVVKGI